MRSSKLSQQGSERVCASEIAIAVAYENIKALEGILSKASDIASLAGNLSIFAVWVTVFCYAGSYKFAPSTGVEQSSICFQQDYREWNRVPAQR